MFIRHIAYKFNDTFLLGNCELRLAHDLMHYFHTRTYHHNISSQFHHQEQSSFSKVIIN